MSLWLSQQEIDDMCEPLTQAAAQVRYLRSEGLAVKLKPNGRPLVLRTNVEAVMGGVPAKHGAAAAPGQAEGRRQPNASAVVMAFQHRK